jgi:pyrimidine-specific ribonucleoside hydrolase
MTTPVLIDVDTGYDDALALLAALRSPQLDVRAISCVAGNQRLPQVVDNTLRLLSYLGDETPVAAGMDRPLLEPLHDPLALHGADGMAELSLPPPRRALEPDHAVDVLRRTLMAAPTPLILICLAPLTNIATLLRMYPAIRAKIGTVMVMGGTLAVHGNTSPLAEFNMRADPEAAAIVLESGLPVRLYPLDVFRKVQFSRAEAAALAAGSAPAAELAGRILGFVCDFFARDFALVGDAGTVAATIDPAGCEVEQFPLTVALDRGVARGMTVLDRRTPGQRNRGTDWWPTSPTEVEVIRDLDASRYRTLLLQAWLGSAD